MLSPGKSTRSSKKTLTPELKAKAHYSFDGHDAGLHRKLAQAGLALSFVAERVGRAGSSALCHECVAPSLEEVGWTTHAISTSGMVGTMIRLFGSDELKRDVLTKIVAGEVVCSLGYSEPGSGSDVFAAQTRATRDGDGWRIDGQKMFTSGANIADYVLMLTRTNPDVPKHKGLTMFIVPLKTPGVIDSTCFHLSGRAYQHHLLRRREGERQLSTRLRRWRRESHGRCSRDGARRRLRQEPEAPGACGRRALS